jgi:curved DNA-binding protein CbpA
MARMIKMTVPDYYRLLGVSPWASERDIRQAYRLLSKQYHPDISPLAPDEALEKFKQINEAYATLTQPLKRTRYDQSLGFSRTAVARPLPSAPQPSTKRTTPAPMMNVTERPLSPTEVFALFILGIAFVASVLLVIFIGLVRH